ncbi:entericidin [Oceaniovalibus sp. ACAM 378]|jgi:predicted small secreted protein|nr:entericidin [Oceaniovalibus sp. ACAM 378]TYB87624.1 entericidin [Oceaniovalibus sp. ACAM 378]
MKLTKIAIAILALTGLVACNTAVGAAKDVYGGTKYVAKKVTGSGEDDK